MEPTCNKNKTRIFAAENNNIECIEGNDHLEINAISSKRNKMQKQDLIYRKQYMQQLRNLKDQNIIKVITGVRRCGKSTLLMMFADELMENGIQKEQIQFYNFEDLDTLAIGDIYQIHTLIKQRLVEDKPNYIFLDEVQNVKEFQRLVDSLYIKPNVDVYITGSNAYMLSGELATLLTGRYVEINVLPLQFSEYYNFIMPKSPNLTKIETLANFIHYGGVPEYVKQIQVGEKQADFFIGKRNNLEVDFVVTDNDGYTSYYQVAWTTENPETLERELASLRAIKDSNPKYLLTTDNDFNPVYDGIRKLNVIDWMLQS